jgi:putative lipoprotein
MRIPAAFARSVFFLTVLLAASCAHHRPPAKSIAAKITGTVTYLQRSALPPEATIEVTFSDVSKPDSAPIQLAHQVIRAQGKQVPIPFEIPYDGRQIVSSHIYGVAAQIKLGEKVLFASDGDNTVLTQGRPSNIEIVVKPAAGAN